MPRTTHIATRGSALALAQANQILAACRAAFPGHAFELKIIKTTGDKLQTASLANPDARLPKGLFTKELEVALLANEADLAVHSLKDLPTELPDGLELGAVTEREDPRDALILREPVAGLHELPAGAVIASSSTRRQAQLRQLRPGMRCVEIRGNVGTRLRKVAEQKELHATMLAMAGLKRLGYSIGPGGRLEGPEVPAGLFALPVAATEMIPAVGQAAIGLEVRADDGWIKELCAQLNHPPTWHCVTAERSFLNAKGGGCQSPVAGHAVIREGRLLLSAVSFQTGACHTANGQGEITQAVEIGRIVAAQIDAPRIA